MKNNEARKMTLAEIIALPKGSVIWMELHDISNDGVVYHSIDPLMVCISGNNGQLIGADEDSIIIHDINDHLLDDSNLIMWDHEPNRNQLIGLSKEEYAALNDPDDDLIVYPLLATEISSRGITFDRFSEMIDVNPDDFWRALTGKRSFEQWEIVEIRSALNLSDNKVEKIFSPVYAG